MPVMVMLVPATRLGVAVPVPPLATGRIPVTPVVNGSPVAFVNVPEAGVPRIGVTSVGDVAKTRLPEPVSSVIAVARLALDGVARNVATPVPRPETPVEIGKPVVFVNVPELGVPSAPLNSTGAPALPTAMPSAVNTPVPYAN